MIRTGKLLLIAMVFVPLVSACRKKPANTPVPRAAADSIAREQARLDSIARATDAENVRVAAERTREENIRAQQSGRSMQTTMAAPIYFELDDANLTPEAVGVLDAKVAVMQREPNMRIRITGHTDEQGSDEYNIALGMRRASETRRFMVERGIAEGRIDAATRGEEEPSVTGHDETAWSRNRRAEFVILSR